MSSGSCDFIKSTCYVYQSLWFTCYVFQNITGSLLKQKLIFREENLKNAVLKDSFEMHSKKLKYGNS